MSPYHFWCRKKKKFCFICFGITNVWLFNCFYCRIEPYFCMHFNIFIKRRTRTILRHFCFWTTLNKDFVKSIFEPIQNCFCFGLLYHILPHERASLRQWFDKIAYASFGLSIHKRLRRFFLVQSICSITDGPTYYGVFFFFFGNAICHSFVPSYTFEKSCNYPTNLIIPIN